MSERLLSLVTGRAAARRSQPRQAELFRELDRVRVLIDFVADEGVLVPAGSVGTVVAIWAQGQAFEVEFTQPVDALATIEQALLELVERAGD